jgi:hypothetical protein
VFLAFNLLSVAALAQDEEAQRYTYATYFHCNVGLEDQADAFMKRNAPILDGLVEDGTILAWGWLKHHTGGDWRRICPRHDDYLWQAEGGTSGKERGKIGFSVYHFCDINREDRADEIVAEHVAPILDKMVEDGKLTTWGWQSHVIGGRARRLQTMTATDMGALLSARQEAIATIYEEDNEAGTEFSDICGPHVDYIWDIVHEAQ